MLMAKKVSGVMDAILERSPTALILMGLYGSSGLSVSLLCALKFKDTALNFKY